jgi:hypothetical protein
MSHHWISLVPPVRYNRLWFSHRMALSRSGRPCALLCSRTRTSTHPRVASPGTSNGLHWFSPCMVRFRIGRPSTQHCTRTRTTFRQRLARPHRSNGLWRFSLRTVRVGISFRYSRHSNRTRKPTRQRMASQAPPEQYFAPVSPSHGSDTSTSLAQSGPS